MCIQVHHKSTGLLITKVKAFVNEKQIAIKQSSSFMGKKRKLMRHPHKNFEYLCLPHSLVLVFPWYSVFLHIEIAVASLLVFVEIIIFFYYFLNSLNIFKRTTFLRRKSYNASFKVHLT